jgi:hypothetical protein
LTGKCDKSNEINGSNDQKEMKGKQMKETRERKGPDRKMKGKQRTAKKRKEKRREELMNVDRNKSKQSCGSAATAAVLYTIFTGFEFLQN